MQVRSAHNGRPRGGIEKATAADIAMLESTLGIKLAADYVQFITEHGAVLFGRAGVVLAPQRFALGRAAAP